MEPRDVARVFDGAQDRREPVERPGSDVESQWFDVRTAAKYLCMTRHAIYHRINRCQLPFIRDGRRIRFDRDALDRWMRKGETRVLTLDEETLLMEALHPRFQRFVRFALGTGCRLDEIRGVVPERDIDWLRGTVHVVGKFRKERDVPMQPDARASLEEQLEEEGKLWKQNPQRLREVLAEGSARAKIPSITPHVLRHTFGTRWLQAGGDIYKLSKILGHSSVAVTEAHYAHLLKEDLVGRESAGEDSSPAERRRERGEDAAATRMKKGGAMFLTISIVVVRLRHQPTIQTAPTFERFLPLLAVSNDALPRGWAQNWAHEFLDAANCRATALRKVAPACLGRKGSHSYGARLVDIPKMWASPSISRSERCSAGTKRQGYRRPAARLKISLRSVTGPGINSDAGFA
jgi:excisionase family DNA binding protein